MGVLLRPTAEMGPWTVELFTGHARFRCAPPVEDATTTAVGSQARPGHDVDALPEFDLAISTGLRLAFTVADLGPLIAALDQVLADGLYCDHIDRHDGDPGRWRQPQVVDGWITIDGPLRDVETRVHDRSVDVDYSHIAELRQVLGDLANSRAADEAAR